MGANRQKLRHMTLRTAVHMCSCRRSMGVDAREWLCRHSILFVFSRVNLSVLIAGLLYFPLAPAIGGTAYCCMYCWLLGGGTGGKG